MGVVLAKRQVGQALLNINSVASSQRKVKAGRLLNPRVYRSEYFGHKFHYCKNGKLGMHGVVHVCERNGYSGMIVEFATKSMKNLTTHDQISL